MLEDMSGMGQMNPAGEREEQTERASIAQRWVVQPLRQLLCMGATPERLAWSLAVGVVVGVNPLLGSTTLVALAAAGAFRLNLVASQLGNHLMYPLELALFPVFVELGSRMFATQRLALGGGALWAAVRQHPWQMTQALWGWEWHALVVWAVFALVAAPVLAVGLRPVLERMAQRPRCAELEADLK